MIKFLKSIFSGFTWKYKGKQHVGSDFDTSYFVPVGKQVQNWTVKFIKQNPLMEADLPT